MIRSFDWRDFPTLHRNRYRGLCLDMSLALTRSMTLVPVGALLSYVAPATGIFTYVSTNESERQERVIGQFSHANGSPFAHLVFLSPETALTHSETLELLDHLAHQAGSRGAHNLLAEVNERSVAFDVLRQAGYGIYARQRVWQVKHELHRKGDDLNWTQATENDESAVRHLYTSLVPALVQQAEPHPWQEMDGLVCYEDDELLGFVQLTYGPNGILAQPVIHPNIEQVSNHLATVIHLIPNRRSRPLYFIVRSHQAWLELFLTEIEAEAGSYQAVMVKRLVTPQKITLPLKLPSTGLDTVQPEISTIRMPIRELKT
jgi:hypothetical protein